MAPPVDRRERETAARDAGANLVVVAGAGTGKTSLLVERLLHQLLERDLPLDRMAAITFTKKAAAELRDRLEDSLERVLDVAGAGFRDLDDAQEADRVLRRLGPGARTEAADRARRAIEALDAAAIGTIHGFAADILRRNHREAGVDLGFEVDDGTAWAELFDELWPRYLEESLGPGKAPGAWRTLLGKIDLDAVERLARRIAGFGIPIEALGDDARQMQKAAVRLHAGRCLADIQRVRAATAGHKCNPRLPGTLDVCEALFTKIGDSGDPPAEAELTRLPKSCSLGKGFDGDPTGDLEATLEGVLTAARRLGASDPDLADELSSVLRPFVARFREEYLRRGKVSYDALIRLARDLLRDHPAVRRAEGARLGHILVDEFQDTDPLQYEIVFFLAERQPPRGSSSERDAFRCDLEPRKLFIVGDPKQSIYHFRGADIRAYGRAVDAIVRTGGRLVTLRANFRSVPELVGPLNELFAAQFPATAAPRGAGDRESFDPEFSPIEAHRPPSRSPPCVEIWSVGGGPLKADERRDLEAKVVADAIRSGIERGEYRPRDVALLLPAFSELDVLLRALRARDVPYVVDGGKGFLSRHEVELLLALLRAVTSPADAVSLVACLRSPVCAVPDEELRLWAEAPAADDPNGPEGATRAVPGGWSLRVQPSRSLFPNLSRALEMLRGIARSHGSEPLDRLARTILDETPLRIAMAASYEGAQRVANLDKAVRRIAELSRDGALTHAEILAEIDETETAGLEEGDSPLADESVDAVSVLTIHKAKGLEWPVVFLPDVAKAHDAPRDSERIGLVPVGPDSGGAPRLGEALALSGGDARTPASARHESDEALHRAAELRRLLYVAATRARERLVLVVGPPRDGRASWVGALAAWGYEVRDGKFPDAETFGGGAVAHRRFDEAPSRRATRGEDAIDASLVEAAIALGRARDAASEAAVTRFRRPSELEAQGGGDDRRDLDPDGSPADASGSGPSRRPVLQAAGTAIHLLLELWDGADPSWLLERSERAARVAAAEAGIEATEVRAQVDAILRRAVASGRIAAIGALAPFAREVPMISRGEKGDVWDGTIDAIAGTPAAPRIVDYKTGAGPGSAEELRRTYAGQLAAYAAAVQRALGLQRPPAADVEPL